MSFQFKNNDVVFHYVELPGAVYGALAGQLSDPVPDEFLGQVLNLKKDWLEIVGLEKSVKEKPTINATSGAIQLAQDYGLNLDELEIVGTGTDGKITQENVQAFVDGSVVTLHGEIEVEDEMRFTLAEETEQPKPKRKTKKKKR